MSSSSSRAGRLSHLLMPLVFAVGVVAGCADEIPDGPLIQGGKPPKKSDDAGASAKTSTKTPPSSPTPPAAPPAGPGGAASSPPTLNAIAPDSVTAGAVPQGVDLTITGKGFGAGTQVDFAGTTLPATVLSATQLAVHVPADRTLASGAFRVTIVAKPASISNALTFTVTAPTSTSDAGAAAAADAGNPACVYPCDDYGYGPGQCFEDWYCIPDGPYAGCLGQTACN